MKDVYHSLHCDQCGRNPRIYIYGDFSIAYCKKHLPKHHKKIIEKMGFKVNNL